VDGRERSYRVYIPQSFGAATAPALVIGLHGGGSNGADFETMTGLSALADHEGFIVAYPNAIGVYHEKLYWNDGRVPEVDDVGFIRRLIDELVGRLGVDPARVYVTGFSNGASMSNRLGVELGDKLAAIAPVAGTLGIIQAQDWQPLRALPVMYVHGTTDPFAYYTGGSAGTWRGSSLSAPAHVAWWAQKNACGPQPQETLLPDRADDGTRVTRSVYSNCRANADVIFYSIDNAGHTWPDGAPWAPEAVTGIISRDFNASEEMWRFFQGHRLSVAGEAR
jgi:polyhydroxybutyrate depolymerase